MKKTLFLLLLLFSLTAFAQEKSTVLPSPDSLALKLENNKDDDLSRAEALLEVIRYFHINRHYIESRPYVEGLSKVSDRLDDAYIKVRADLAMGVLINETENDINQALRFIHSAYVLASQLPENEQSIDLRVRIYNNLGTCYSQWGWAPEGYECSIQTMAISSR